MRVLARRLRVFRVKGLVKDEYWIGIDLGGTWVRVAVSDKDGHFMAKISEKVDKGSAKAISDQMIRLTRFLCNKHGFGIKSLKGAGIAATGPLVQEEGVLIHPTAMPFDYVPITKPISEELGIPSCLINDAAGAALGEKMFGAAKGLDNYAYITISTGIGCGAIVNGTLLLGKDGNAHEVGHIVIDYEGRLTCGCGKRGHWEAYCSGSNIPNFIRMRLKDVPKKTAEESLLLRMVGGDLSRLSAIDLFAAAGKADNISARLVEEIGVLNAIGFANVINVYDPSLITVGGTVTLKNRAMILNPIRKHVKDYVINRIPKIKVTPLGDDVGLYGAIAAALTYISWH
jgi:glucokinase